MSCSDTMEIQIENPPTWLANQDVSEVVKLLQLYQGHPNQDVMLIVKY